MTGRLAVLVALGLVLTAGGGVMLFTWGQSIQVQETQREMNTMSSIPNDHWKQLAGKRVFFGHQSVGDNIVDGIKDLMGENPNIQVEIIDLEHHNTDIYPGFYHMKIGRNTRPKSKLNAFRRELEKRAEVPFDIALMKFCYVDLRDGDDPEAVFDLYKTTMFELEARYPETVFIHSTMPIEAVNSTMRRRLKESVKSLIGRRGVVEDNWVRQRYNDLVRSSYEGRGWVFDIAQAEISAPDGSESYKTLDGQKVFLMDGRYSYDGGHLNELGRKSVAEQLLMVLTMAASSPHPSDSK